MSSTALWPASVPVDTPGYGIGRLDTLLAARARRTVPPAGSTTVTESGEGGR